MTMIPFPVPSSCHGCSSAHHASLLSRLFSAAGGSTTTACPGRSRRRWPRSRSSPSCTFLVVEPVAFLNSTPLAVSALVSLFCCALNRIRPVTRCVWSLVFRSQGLVLQQPHWPRPGLPDKDVQVSTDRSRIRLILNPRFHTLFDHLFAF
jgi:hypothetical protein